MGFGGHAHRAFPDFTDSTNIYKSAHFDKKGGIRVTADDRMISLEDTKRKTNIKWKKVR